MHLCFKFKHTTFLILELGVNAPPAFFCLLSSSVVSLPLLSRRVIFFVSSTYDGEQGKERKGMESTHLFLGFL